MYSSSGPLKKSTISPHLGFPPPHAIDTETLPLCISLLEAPSSLSSTLQRLRNTTEAKGGWREATQPLLRRKPPFSGWPGSTKEEWFGIPLSTGGRTRAAAAAAARPSLLSVFGGRLEAFLDLLEDGWRSGVTHFASSLSLVIFSCRDADFHRHQPSGNRRREGLPGLFCYSLLYFVLGKILSPFEKTVFWQVFWKKYLCEQSPKIISQPLLTLPAALLPFSPPPPPPVIDSPLL